MTRNKSTALRHAGYGLVAMMSLLTIVSGPARAADPYSSVATPAQRAACTPDVYRLCAGEIPSVPGITACLRRKKASLSEACRAVFEQ